jgi:hypothetical protein
MTGFTYNEKEIMEKLVEAHALYIDLNKQHPSDMPEWANAIHDLQKLMAMRIVRREHPDIFPIHE